MDLDLESFVERLNAGEPIPEVKPEYLRAALSVLSDSRAILDRAELLGTLAGLSRPTIGIFLGDRALSCMPSTEVLPAVLRAALASVILHLPRTHEERPDPVEDDFIVRMLAEIPLVAAELKDPEAILKRIEEMARGKSFDKEV